MREPEPAGDTGYLAYHPRPGSLVESHENLPIGSLGHVGDDSELELAHLSGECREVREPPSDDLAHVVGDHQAGARSDRREPTLLREQSNQLANEQGVPL